MTAYPKRLDDDGQTLVVDVHGCSVRDGMFIVRRCVQEAHRRGRTKVEVIHGVSTSVGSENERTIKNELARRLASGEFGDRVTSQTSDTSGGRTVLWLPLGLKQNPSRIRIEHVVPR